MSTASYNSAPPEERPHFIRCRVCGEMIDCRDLDEVVYHEDHVPRPDIQYSGSRKTENAPGSATGVPQLENAPHD